ncbi:hypothetical protein P2G88_06555 [Aliiglaciecola sp. CAU 1673]|uniref:hypothetical protein n=1 Tax=Aliiglaciecola sp. CAU 1673 TaxID=3032595 RepID=UPI0023DC2DE3|nr:hypothetical protein [Aliiglaciecola sp. CAU 1673]MDF2177908.1 hypothetical protein [Aliiglaciecola sp. CAU 1673]
MAVISTTQALNNGISRQIAGGSTESTSNAFGIGAANQEPVQLSPEAVVLQRAEQGRVENRLQVPSENPTRAEEEETQENESVRVSTSLGQSAQSGGLTAEKATALYRSIERML